MKTLINVPASRLSAALFILAFLLTSSACETTDIPPTSGPLDIHVAPPAKKYPRPLPMPNDVAKPQVNTQNPALYPQPIINTAF